MRAPRILILLCLALAVNAAGVGAALTPASAQQADWQPPWIVYIPETGHTISGVFLDAWRAWGGAGSWGNPVTEELTENGHTVQYYEYARFEYWPEDPAAPVHFGAIGQELRPFNLYRPTSASRSSGPSPSLAAELAWLPNDNAGDRPNSDTWRYAPESRHAVQLGFKEFWERTGEAGYLGNPLTEEYASGGVTYQVFERGQLAWQKDRGVWMLPLGRNVAMRHGLELEAAAQGDVPTYSEELWVPPAPQPDPNAERWIEVNLSTQYLIAWQGDVSVLESYVSTGRPGFETPTGTFFINSKLESQTMEGVIGGEYYNVPDVPWVMYFTDEGHALHGTYWHNNFGAVMSHGCVNLPMDVAAWMYEWAPIGTRVVIHY